jgi:hypothetical protein
MSSQRSLVVPLQMEKTCQLLMAMSYSSTIDRSPEPQNEMLELRSRGHNNSTRCSISICEARNRVLVTVNEPRFESPLSKMSQCVKAHIAIQQSLFPQDLQYTMPWH